MIKNKSWLRMAAQIYSQEKIIVLYGYCTLKKGAVEQTRWVAGQ